MIIVSNAGKIEEPKMFGEKQDVSRIMELLDDEPAFYLNGSFKKIFHSFYKKIVKNTSFQILYSSKNPIVKIKGDNSSLPFVRKKWISLHSTSL